MGGAGCGSGGPGTGGSVMFMLVPYPGGARVHKYCQQGRMGSMRETRAAAHGLRTAIERSGYYPALVADAVESALGTEPVLAFVVHHEATFDPAMEVRRHVTVLVLSPTRMLACHTDEHPPSDAVPQPHASTTTEAVRLDRVHSVAVTRVVPEPASYVPGMPPTEAVLTIGWGVISHIDLEPATCGDESCEADHGYTGSIAADDLQLRVSEAADGAAAVSQVLSFAQALSEATRS
jgi:hypothetical protein